MDVRLPTQTPTPVRLASLQEARNWDAMGATEPRKGGGKGEKQLDFSADGPADGPTAAALAPLAIGKSRVDADEDDYSSEEEEGDAEVSRTQPRLPRGAGWFEYTCTISLAICLRAITSRGQGAIRTQRTSAVGDGKCLLLIWGVCARTADSVWH